MRSLFLAAVVVLLCLGGIVLAATQLTPRNAPGADTGADGITVERATPTPVPTTQPTSTPAPPPSTPEPAPPAPPEDIDDDDGDDDDDDDG